MKISVVIPAYNEEELLPKLLESLNHQDFPRSDFEIIVVDNNSTDKTAEIARSYNARVVKELRQGITYARNTGAFSARAPLIVGTDADCELPKNYLSSIYKKFSHSKKLVLVCTSVVMPDSPLAMRLIQATMRWLGNIYLTYSKQVPLFLCWGQNFSYRKKAFERIGGFELDAPLLKMGLNTDGSDDFGIVKRFKETGGQVTMEPKLVITSSGRRFKNRLMYWFFIEYFLGFVVNRNLYRHFGIVVPVPSYYQRIIPSNTLSYSLLIIFFSMLTAMGVYVSVPGNSQQITQIAQNQLKNLIVLRSDLQQFSEKITTQSLLP